MAAMLQVNAAICCFLEIDQEQLFESFLHGRSMVLLSERISCASALAAPDTAQLQPAARSK